ncbi:MAG: AraC family transcriptional activator FtrA [Arenicella sp.]|jgi:AraC family transcriptional activator FtrA
MHNVAILSYNNIALFEFGCATELFALPRPEFEHWYNTEIIAFDAGPYSSTGGISIRAQQIDSLDAYDTLVMPSWPINVSKVKGVFADEVKRFHRQGKRILTFCSGAFLLASLGILDKRKPQRIESTQKILEHTTHRLITSVMSYMCKMVKLAARPVALRH